jgi:hypothetical protein
VAQAAALLKKNGWVMMLKVFSIALLALVTSTCHVVAQEPQTIAATAKLPAAEAPAKALETKTLETKTFETKAAPTATPSLAALDQLMTAFAAAQKKASFRARLNSQVNDDEPDVLTLEVLAPNRRRIKGHNIEIIVVGEDGYLSFGSKWQKALRDPDAQAAVIKVAHAPVFWGLAENEAARGFITMKSVTSTTYEEQAATLFEYEMKDAFGKTGVCTLRTWVTHADGLPRKTEMKGAYEGRNATAILTWLEYDAALKIEAPALP